MDEIKILEIKLIGAGIVFIAFALIVIIGYSLGPYLNIISPNDSKLLIFASHASFIVTIITAFSTVYSILRHKD